MPGVRCLISESTGGTPSDVRTAAAVTSRAKAPSLRCHQVRLPSAAAGLHSTDCSVAMASSQLSELHKSIPWQVRSRRATSYMIMSACRCGQLTGRP